MATSYKPLKDKLRAFKITGEENKKIEKLLKKRRINFTDLMRELIDRELAQ